MAYIFLLAKDMNAAVHYQVILSWNNMEKVYIKVNSFLTKLSC